MDMNMKKKDHKKVELRENVPIDSTIFFLIFESCEILFALMWLFIWVPSVQDEPLPLSCRHVHIFYRNVTCVGYFYGIVYSHVRAGYRCMLWAARTCHGWTGIKCDTIATCII